MIFLLIVLIAIVAIYFTFFFSYKCEDIACFQAHQEKCSKTEFINDDKAITWAYKINGKKDGKCEINVEILQIKEGSLDKKVLEGKSMNCYLPIGSKSFPEKDISVCHGLLKEEFQDIMLKNAHKYIVENIGEINAELNKVV